MSNTTTEDNVVLHCDRLESDTLRNSLVGQSRRAPMMWCIVLTSLGCLFSLLATLYRGSIGVEWSAASVFGLRILLVVAIFSGLRLAYCMLKGWWVRRSLKANELTIQFSPKRIDIGSYIVDLQFWNQRLIGRWKQANSKHILCLVLRRESWSLHRGRLRWKKNIEIPLPQHEASDRKRIERLYRLAIQESPSTNRGILK